MSYTFKKFEWEKLLAGYLSKLCEGELEFLRKKLAKIVDFEPKLLFRRLDKLNKRSLTINDIKQYLRDSAVKFKDELLSLFISQYSRNKDFLCYEDFLKIILTKSDIPLRETVLTRKRYEGVYFEYLDFRIEDVVSEILKVEVSLAEKAEEFVNAIKACPEFTLYEGFSIIDFYRTQSIEEEGLALYMRNHGYKFLKSEIILLLTRLDFDNDGKVSYEDFKRLLLYEPSGKSFNVISHGRNQFPISSTKADSPKKQDSESFMESMSKRHHFSTPSDKVNKSTSLHNESFHHIIRIQINNVYSDKVPMYASKVISNHLSPKSIKPEFVVNSISNNYSYSSPRKGQSLISSYNQYNMHKLGNSFSGNYNNEKPLRTYLNESQSIYNYPKGNIEAHSSQYHNKMNNSLDLGASVRKIADLSKLNQASSDYYTYISPKRFGNQPEDSLMYTATNNFTGGRGNRQDDSSFRNINGNNLSWNNNQGKEMVGSYDQYPSNRIGNQEGHYVYKNFNDSQHNSSMPNQYSGKIPNNRLYDNTNDYNNQISNEKSDQENKFGQSANPNDNSSNYQGLNSLPNPNYRNNTSGLNNLAGIKNSNDHSGKSNPNSFSGKNNIDANNNSIPLSNNLNLSNTNFFGQPQGTEFSEADYDQDLLVFFSKFLANVLAMYNKLENIRETLNIDTGIFLDDLYKFFDPNHDMSINIKEFQDKLVELKVNATIDDLKLIFKRYDLEQNLSISYEEFCNMIYAKNPEYKKMIIKNSNSNDDDDEKNFEYFKKSFVLKKFFRILIDCENNFEDKRKILVEHPKFSLFELYDALREGGGTVVTMKDLLRFLRKFKVEAEEYEIEILWDVFDKNRSGDITFKEKRFTQKITSTLNTRTINLIFINCR